MTEDNRPDDNRPANPTGDAARPAPPPGETPTPGSAWAPFADRSADAAGGPGVGGEGDAGGPAGQPGSTPPGSASARGRWGTTAQAGHPAQPTPGGVTQGSEWAAQGQPARPGSEWVAPGAGWGGQQQYGQPTQERVLFGSAAPGATPPTGNYLPNPNAPSRPFRDVPPPQQKKSSSAMVAGVAALALVFGGGAGALGGYLVADSASNAPVVNALDQKPAEHTSSKPADGSVEAVAEKMLPTVVQLQVQGRSSAGEGSGFIISSDGLIVTNNHVVEAAAEQGRITAVFQDGSSATATIVGRDPSSDVAVVKADKDGLPVVELGSSEALRVGQQVVAIGSPFELSGTVTSGIVSALHRPTKAGGEDGSQATVMDAIQTDAAINPGNSGGPLVNMRGQVVGINSAIYTPPTSGGQGGSVGIGFAIPIDQARRTAEEISKTGKATQTVLGVSVKDNPDGGALIVDVVPGGAGEKAGLKDGDVVTRMDERRIPTSDALVAAVRSKAPGDKVRLELDNGSRTVEATLAGQTVEPE